MRYPAKFAVAMVTAALTVAAAMPIALADTAMPFEPDPKLSEDQPVDPVDPTDPSEDPKPIVIRAYDMLRLYNRYTGEHFYTSSTYERDSLVNVGWTDEGIGWHAPANSKTPVYRLYNPYADGGDHHYTTSATESLSLIEAGWSYEGIGWYSDDNETTLIYRQYNPFAVSGTHNYTPSKFENDELVKLGWKEEGIGWYGVEFTDEV
ncbi:hypothetical protein [Olsenella intestinalis]|uniref:hypothetical protein n=1 Tax=Olsenella intestinalis TaxID=2930083 RepID=UPI00200EA903|nr:hypothetical protein [Olsenella intestinalis]